MKIAILEGEPSGTSATIVRGRAIARILSERGHQVEVLSPSTAACHARFRRERLGLVPRLRRRVFGAGRPRHLWDFLADDLVPRLRKGRYDAVIARGQDLGYALTLPMPGLKILDMANILFLESYYTWGPDLDDVDATFVKEMAVFESVDYILSPHEILTRFFLDQFDAGRNLARKTITVRLGSEPASRHARYAAAARIVYAGSYHYIQDPYLLAQLSRTSPFPIDCYGGKDPSRRFLPSHLNYRGYAASTDFLADYQLGLITVSRDRLRQHSPATKFPYYFAHGLPVLFPDWMKEGHEYGDCAIPFNEEDFVSKVRLALDPDRWHRMADAALRRSASLLWDRTLEPLLELLQEARS